MSEENKGKLQAFARKMQDEGADGFANGPRPWEEWDESGSQADSRVWEGNARRVPVKQQPARSTGDRLLSAMATIALATLIIGIGGVYFSEYPAQQIAQTGIQPPPILLTPIRRFPPEQHASLTAPDVPPQVIPVADSSPTTIPAEPEAGVQDDISESQQSIPAEEEIPIIALQRIIPVTRPPQDPVAADIVATENVTETQEVATTETTASTPAPVQVTAAAEEQIETLNKLEAPAAKAGNWVVNLASYTWKSTANKKIEVFRSKGVDAELVTVTINDKPMHRVRVTGFGSSKLAKQQISSLEEQLDLEGAWISRR
jgi:cell division septation protein DedD